jgi:hypothetical protein
MSDEHEKTHRPIRTFAQDLADAREKRGQSSTDSSSVVLKENTVVTEVEKENHTAQAPAQTTHAEQNITFKEKTPVKHTTQPVIKESKKIKPTPTPTIEHIKSSPAPSTKNEQKKSKIVPKISVRKTTGPEKKNIGYDTAIITDNKNERFNLFQAVGTSLKSWFKTLSFSRKKKSPVYTVPDTERRKGVIKKATSKSGSIFTADSAELRAKIKQRQKQAEEAKLKLEEEEGDVSWSPFTDPGYNLIESPEAKTRVVAPHNVSVEFKKSTTQPKELPVETAQPTEAMEAPSEPVFEPTESEKVNEMPSRWDTVSAEIETEAVVEVPVEVPVEKIVASEKTNKAPSPTKQTRKEFNLQSLNTNVLAMSIVAGISMIIVIFFVVSALVGYITSSDVVVTQNNTSYLETATPNPVVINQISTPTDIPLQAGVLLGLDYVDTQLLFENGVIVPPENIAAVLGFNLLPSFTKALTDIRFAQINASAPVIILEFSTVENAMGGLLAWEETMANDLKELYLITQTTNSIFVDDTIKNTDVRILKSSDGEVLAVYGIITSDTAIIANSVDTFSQIINASFTN